MDIKIPVPFLIVMMATIPILHAQNHTLVTGATAWDDVTANWSNPSNQLVVYPNATSTNAFISGPRTVTTTVPRTVGRLTLTNGVVLSGQQIVVW
jgi:hypothetical protein